ncbi:MULTISPECIES: BA14K family protein [unclassified Rhizobium]
MWCSGRYASYRTDDNTYQPYGGPRRECVSPFPEGSSIITVSQ